ncbi:MAG TPA: trigger factor [Verrucomicrobiae bacterium]|nr:trigger factor [Verrucomicrobiae bacterium]
MSVRTHSLMITSRKDLPKSRVKLTITANAAQFRHAFDHELESVAKDTKVEGFRPGKAPKTKVLQQVGRQRIEASAMDHAISHAYYDALEEAKLVPVSSPSVEVTNFVAPSDETKDDEVAVTFDAEVDIVPDVKVDGYQKIKAKMPKLEPVTEADIDEVVAELRRQRARLEPAEKDTKVEKDMWAEIRFSGSVGGVKREDMQSQAHPVIVGKGQLIPGFEENMIGLKEGEETTFKITFPKDYHATELAGKEAEFTVGINELKAMVMPELNDEFALSYGQKDLVALRDMVKNNLEEERKEKQTADLEEDILAKLLDIAKFDAPESLVAQEVERVIKDNKDRFQRMQVSWEQYLAEVKKNEEEVREDIRPQAEKNVRIGLALGKVIQEEKIEASSAEAMRQAMDRLIEIATK